MIVMILHNIRSMHNVGSIFRTADAFGVDLLMLCGFTPHPPHRDITKTALGATDSVTWKSVDNTLDAITEARTLGCRVVALEQHPASVPLMELAVYPRMAVVLGNEVEGIPLDLIALCDIISHIPQQGIKKSLNVSVCAGIACWHLRSELGRNNPQEQ